jgi:hypothetical protein
LRLFFVVTLGLQLRFRVTTKNGFVVRNSITLRTVPS